MKRPTLKKSAAVVAAAAALALAGNGISYATTGYSLVGGDWNKTDATTTIHDTAPGPALRLVTKGNHEPSLSVSSMARVPHLNASMLQGRYASDLASHALVFTTGRANQGQFTGQVGYGLDIAPGVYDVSVNAAIHLSEGSPAEPSEAFCAVIGMNESYFPLVVASDLYVGGALPAVLSASNVVRVRPGGAAVICDASSTSARFVLPLTASFVKLNTLTRLHAMAAPLKTQHLPSFLK